MNRPTERALIGGQGGPQVVATKKEVEEILRWALGTCTEISLLSPR